MGKLSEAGYIDVLAGRWGGYKIIKDVHTIYLYQILGLVEGLDDFNRCALGFSECSNENPCSLHHRWMKYNEGIKDMIYNTSLADLDYSHIQKY
jgi:Rrf2 family protein